MGRYETTAADVGSPLGILSGWRLGLCLAVLALTVIAIAAIDLQRDPKSSAETKESASLALQFAADTPAQRINKLATQFNLDITSADPKSGHYVVEGQFSQSALAAFLELPNLLNFEALPNAVLPDMGETASAAQQSLAPAQ